jgi:ferrous iron transport protein A
VKLSELKPGQEAVIVEFSGEEVSIKLMEMGLVPGESVLLEQVAPLGDPISVNVSGYHLSLRLNEAEQIFVRIKH